MTQIPVLTAETTTSVRDPVVREVFGITNTYANLSAAHKATVDQEINASFIDVVSRGKWFAEINPTATDLPTEWNELFRQMTVARLKRHFRSTADYAAHWRIFVEPLQDRIADHYTAAWMATTPQATDIVTAVTLRQQVIAVIIRQRHPVFMPVAEIDRVIREEFVRLWMARYWKFRRKMLKVSLQASTGNITTSSTYSIACIASRKFRIIGSSDSASSDVTWLDSNRAIEAAAAYDGQTGRPLYFYTTWNDGREAITFIPLPDQAYTAYVMVYIGAPPFTPTGMQGDIDGLRMLPPELRGHLRDRAISHIIGYAGREDNDATRLMNKVERDYVLHCGQWDDGGPSEDPVPLSQRGVLNQLMSYGGGNVLRPIG